MTTSKWNTILAPLALIVMIVTVAAANPYVDGNRAAARGDHVAAARAFEQSIEHNGWSANSLLSLSNAYASAGETGRAILALERARVIAPNDKQVAENLETLRERAGVVVAEPSRVQATLERASADTWTWIAFGGLAVTCAGMIVIAWTGRRRLGLTLAVLGATFGVLSGLSALRVAPDRNLAIVVAPEPARIAPFAAAEVAFAPRPGERVQIEQRRDDHVYVRASGQRSGWISKTAVESVIPADRRAPNA